MRFGPYEADLSSGELHKGGSKLRIQPQPFNLLSLLLRRHGEVVTRQELQQALWPDDTYVEFNASLNAAIKKLRRTIMDDPRRPRYIETLPRTGYRFSFPVEWVHEPAQPSLGGPVAVAAPGSAAHRERGDDRSVGDSGHRVWPSAEASVWDAARRGLTPGRVLTWALAVALLAVAYLHWIAPEPQLPVRRFAIQPGAGITDFGGSISPDGLHVVYAVFSEGRRRLMLRSLDSESAHELPGTAGAVGGFWAPDSLSVGFATDTELRAVTLDGEEPVTLCKLPESDVPFGGGSWSGDGLRIVFSSGELLYEVPAAGGQAKLLFERDSFRSNYSHPHFLPGGSSNALVYTAAVSPFDQMLAVLDLETGESRTLGPGSAPVYSSLDGHLVYGPSNSEGEGLMAIPFSLDTLAASGRAFLITDRGVEPSVSKDGILVYLERPRNLVQLVRRDREGVVGETIGQPQLGLRMPALSRRQRSIAVTSQDSGTSDIWLVDAANGSAARLTFEPGIDDEASWSPDGSQVVFSRQGRSGEGSSVLSKPVSGDGEAAVIVSAQGRLANPEWSPDGGYLTYSDYSGGPRSDIRFLEFHDGAPSQAKTFLGTAASEHSAKFFPLGEEYIAYVSNQTGRYEIYVARFPDATEIQKASLNGGRRARWRGDGGELYYIEGTTLVAVPVAVTSKGLRLGRPQRLFETRDLGAAGYAPSADGRSFITVSPAASAVPAAPALHIVENWSKEYQDGNH